MDIFTHSKPFVISNPANTLFLCEDTSRGFAEGWTLTKDLDHAHIFRP